jgi:hypothetical protein
MIPGADDAELLAAVQRAEALERQAAHAETRAALHGHSVMDECQHCAGLRAGGAR